MPPTPTLHNFTYNLHHHDNNNNGDICGNRKNRKRSSSGSTITKLSVPQPRSHHGSSTQACAACKYQRRKCASDCILAPYFPHDHQRQFSNAHRLFGVSNIIKIVRHMDPQARDHAMRTIIFQSDVRAADPIGGCYRMIRDLEERISLAKAELEIVLHQLAICRVAAAQQQMMPPSDNRDCEAHGGNLGAHEDEKWKGEYAGEDEVVNSWACNIPTNVYAESTSDSLPQQNNYHSEECNDISSILEQLTCDDVEVGVEDHFRFDSNGNIVPSNNGVPAEEQREDDRVTCGEDHNDLNAAVTFFSLNKL